MKKIGGTMRVTGILAQMQVLMPKSQSKTSESAATKVPKSKGYPDHHSDAGQRQDCSLTETNDPLCRHIGCPSTPSALVLNPLERRPKGSKFNLKSRETGSGRIAHRFAVFKSVHSRLASADDATSNPCSNLIRNSPRRNTSIKQQLNLFSPCRLLSNHQRVRRIQQGEDVKPWQYQSRPLGADDVEIKISHCGICGSDIHSLDSGWGPTTYLRQRGGAVQAVRGSADAYCPHLVWTYNDRYKEDGAITYGGSPRMGAPGRVLSLGEQEDEVRALGADEFVNYSDDAQAKKAAGSVDVLLLTADANNMPYSLFMSFLAIRGTCVMVGLPNDELKFHPFFLVGNGNKLMGSKIGSIADIKDMLALAAAKNVRPIIQKMPMSKVNEGLAMVRNGTVRYRVVLEN
ncbi:hypothetical protein FI667_g11849, partial [Globisporangium splendens]